MLVDRIKVIKIIDLGTVYSADYAAE